MPAKYQIIVKKASLRLLGWAFIALLVSTPSKAEGASSAPPVQPRGPEWLAQPWPGQPLANNSQDQKSQTQPQGSLRHSSTEDSPFALVSEPNRPRNFWLFPALSFIFPGADQLIEGQWAYGAAYQAVFWGGVIHQVQNSDELEALQQSRRFKSLSKEEQADELKFNETARRSGLAAQISLASGSFSAYHAFRSAVRSQKPYGRFRFLPHEESPAQLLLAPFEFSHIKKPRVYVPLALLASIWALRSQLPVADYVERPLTSSDVFYTGAYSYLAGTHEEALFRGTLMPALRESVANDFWSNTLTSIIFAAAHLNTVSVPVAQLLLGWHLGAITQANGWRLSEAIFLHAWWDILAFAMNYQYRYEKGAQGKAYLPLTLPPVTLYF